MNTKRMTGVVCACLFLLGLSGQAWAQGMPNLTSYGSFKALMSFVDNYGFEEGEGDEQMINQELRQYFEYAANENLSATVAYEISSGWGWEGESGFGNDATGQIEIKRAQLDFAWPNTDVTFNVGLSGWVAPGGPFGTPVLAGDMPGAFMNVPVTDRVSLTAGYIRASDQSRIHDVDDDDLSGDQLDASLLSLPISMDGWNVEPYFIYSWIGENSEPGLDINDFQNWGMGLGTFATQLSNDLDTSTWNTHSDEAEAYWVGLPFGIDLFDPLTIKGQFIYGQVDGDTSAMDRDGYYFDIGVDYAMDMFTPSVYFLYSSGEDDDISDGSETFPTLYSDGYVYPPSGVAIGFNTQFGMRDGDYSMAQYIPHAIWTLGFALKDIQFMDRLEHTLAFAYSQGTHDDEVFTDAMTSDELGVFKDGRFQEFTDEDSVYEITLHNTYDIYDNLQAVLEFGYASLDMEEDVWGNDYRDEDVLVSSFGLSYSF